MQQQPPRQPPPPVAFPPLPSGHPLNVLTEPLNHWESDQVLRIHLQFCREPTGAPDYVYAYSLLRMFEARLAELRTVYARVQLDGRRSDTVERHLAAALLHHRYMLWQIFPICTLPTEILSLIFRFVVWSSHGADAANKHRMVLTWVCKRFREVAIGDQTLWNSIWFRDPAPWVRSLTFLERSGTAPLDLRIDEPGTQSDTNAPTDVAPMSLSLLDALLDALLPKIGQIRILVVYLKGVEAVERFAARFARGGFAERLERYELHRLDQPYLWPPERCHRVHGGHFPISYDPTPRLRWVCFNGVTTDWDAFPNEGLRTLDIRRLSVQACPPLRAWNKILNASSLSITRLMLDAAGPQLSEAFNVEPIELPYLREMSLTDVSCEFARLVVMRVRAPKLMCLVLVNLFQQDYTPLIVHITGLYPEIRMLTVVSVDLVEDELTKRKLVRWFETMPECVVLKLQRTSRFILDALKADPSEYWDADKKAAYAAEWKAKGQEPAPRPILMPKLGAVIFQLQATDDISSLAIARKELGLPLRKVYTPAANWNLAGPEEIARIQANVGQLETVQVGWNPEEEEDIQEVIQNTLPPELRTTVYRLPPKAQPQLAQA